MATRERCIWNCLVCKSHQRAVCVSIISCSSPQSLGRIWGIWKRSRNKQGQMKGKKMRLWGKVIRVVGFLLFQIPGPKRVWQTGNLLSSRGLKEECWPVFSENLIGILGFSPARGLMLEGANKPSFRFLVWLKTELASKGITPCGLVLAATCCERKGGSRLCLPSGIPAPHG